VKSKAFRTSFGREIPFIDGYYDAHQKGYLANAVVNNADWPPERRLSFWQLSKDVFEYSLVVDFLDYLGIPMNWERLLDIGGAEGTMARLFRGEGKAKHTTVIEAVDKEYSLPDDLFMALFEDFQGIIRGGLSDPRCQARGFRGLVNDFGYHPPKGSKFYNLSLRSDPVVDKYLVQDVYELNDRFDCITAFVCVPWFDLEKLFSKAYSLLTEGGVFCILQGCWWYPVNATLIVGDFPYACQRLHREDLKRYFDETRPEETERMLTRYDWYHQGKQRPTLDDFVDLAYNAGFSLLGARRFSPVCDTHDKTPVTPFAIDRYEGCNLKDVLDDIHHFRPDVRMMDLLTANMMMAFTKQPKCRDHLSQYIHQMKEKNDYGVYLRDLPVSL